MSVPKLAEIRCEKIQFNPGDRILVRVYEKLSNEQDCRLRKTIERWAGTDINILIVCEKEVDFQIERQ